MKNKRKRAFNRYLFTTPVLVGIVIILSYSLLQLNQKIREKQFIDGNYYSFKLGLYAPIPEGFKVIERNNKIIFKKDRTEFLIEKVPSESKTSDDFIVEYINKNNVTTQDVSTIFDTYKILYINGRSATTEKGYIKKIDRNTFVVMTVNDPNEYNALDFVLGGLKYVKEK